MALIGANVPFLVSILMAIVAAEQYYLLRPMIKTYRLTEAREIVVLSSPFFTIFVGALVSGVIDLPLILVPQPTATDLLVASSLIRTIFEIAAFSLFILIPFRGKRKIPRLLFIPPLAAMGINFAAIAVFFIYLAVNVHRVTVRKESNFVNIILSIGTLLLITSKVTLVYPTEMLSIYAKELVASIMELFGLSNFLILKEGLVTYVEKVERHERGKET